MTDTASTPMWLVESIAAACRVDPETIGRATRLADLQLDSLTFVSVLAGIEAACGVEFDTEVTLRCLAAHDVGDLLDIVRSAAPQAAALGSAR